MNIKNAKKKGIFMFGMAVLLLQILGFQNITAVKASDEQENSKFEQFEIEAKTNFNNQVKHTRNTQMRVKVTNRGEDFDGLVQLVTTVNQTQVMYQDDLSIRAGETKVVEIPFRMQGMDPNILVEIVDKDEEVLGEEKVKLKIIQSYDYFIGVLTENKEGVSGLDGFKVQTIQLKQENMSDTWEGLDALDRIYINDFQTNTLTAEQYEALKIWVEKGGDLMIGTGQYARDTLGIFRDDFLKGKIGELKKGGRVELSFEGEKTYKESISDGDGKKEYELHRIDIGKGSVWVYDIDLTASEGKGEEKQYIQDQLVQQFEKVEFPNTDNENAIYVNEGMDYTDKSEIPNIFIYSIVYIFYIISISVLLYSILKKKDMLEKMWIAIPVFSFLFVAVMYVLGNQTRITGPYIKYQGIVRFTGEEDTNPFEKNILEVASASNKDYTVVIPDGRTVYPSESTYYDSENDPLGYGMGFYKEEGKQFVTMKNVPAFQKQRMLSEQTRNMGQGYESNLVSNKMECGGTFTNHTGYTLKHAVLFTGYICYSLGSIKDGETIEINEKTPKLLCKNYNDFVEDSEELILGTNDESEMSLEAFRYKEIVIERRSTGLDWEMDEEEGEFDKDFFYSGVIYSNIDWKEDREKMSQEWGMDCDGITICSMPVDIKYEYNGEEFVANILSEGKEAIQLNEHQSHLGWTIQGANDYLDFEYALKKGETLKGIYYLKACNPSIYQKNSQWSFKGEIFAFNYKTQKYEVIFESGKEKSIRDVKDYTDEKNILKLRVVTDKVQDQEDSIEEEIPAISVSKK